MDVRNRQSSPRRQAVLGAALAIALSVMPSLLDAADAPAPVQEVGFARAVDLLRSNRQTDDALRMLTALAQQGDARAQVLLAGAYFDGKLAPPDPVKGYAWLQVATSGQSYFQEDTADWAQEMMIAHGSHMTGPQLIAAESMSAGILAKRAQAEDDGIRAALRARYTSVEPTQVRDGVRFAEAIRVTVPDREGESPLFSPGCAMPGAFDCPDRAARDATNRRCTGDIMPPDAIASTNGSGADAPPPAYPLSARRLGLEGRTIILLHVDRSGWVCGVSVVMGSGSSVLDKSAIDTARKWRMAPAMLGEQPVESFTTFALRFRISGYKFKQ